MMEQTTHTFETESRTKIGNTTYVVISHFDDTRECLQEKICQLLKSEVESRIAQLRGSA